MAGSIASPNESGFLWWRHEADALLPDLALARDRLDSIVGFVDDHFPSWSVGMDSADFLSRDARREFFRTLRVVLQNEQLTYGFIRDHLSYPEWWSDHRVDPSSPVALGSIGEYDIMAKFVVVHSTVNATEETLRAIIRSAPSGTFSKGITPVKPLESIYKHILKVLNLQGLGGIFEIVRLIGNTRHTNGIFIPSDGKDLTITYEGRDFPFEYGRPIDWDRRAFLFLVPLELTIAMAQVVTAPEISAIPYCPRFAPLQRVVTRPEQD